MRMLADNLSQLAFVVALAALLGIGAKMLRQPTILAYVAAGMAVGWFGFFHLEGQELFGTLADLGITFLLFLVGMEINYSALRAVGKSAIIAGLGQVILTGAAGFGISTLLSFPLLPSLYLGAGLAFSSTIVVVKLLSEKGSLNSLPGKLGLGILLVQDIVVILLLVALSGIKDGEGIALLPLLSTIAAAAALFAAMLWLGRRVMPAIFDAIAHSRELLFLASIAWCLAVAVAVAKAGFSVGIGGFLAGVALANSSERYQISARVQTLRDFFLVAFFALLGSSLVFLPLEGLLLPVAIFSLFVLIGNPIIVWGILGFMGHRRKTSFFVGLSVAQLSEFSLILGALGVELGHIQPEILSILTASTIITIILSTYAIEYDEWLFRLFGRYLAPFERARPLADALAAKRTAPSVLLIGGNRVGRMVAEQMPKDRVLVVDYDPDVIRRLREEGYESVFGDIADREVQEESGLQKARLVVSTSPAFRDNMELIKILRSRARRPQIVVRAETEMEARALYESGADYVLFPHATAGYVLGRTLADSASRRVSFAQLKKTDLRFLSEHGAS